MQRRRTGKVALVALLAVLAACSNGSSDTTTAPPATAPASTSVPPQSSGTLPPSPPPPARPGPVTFAFAGDVHFADETYRGTAPHPTLAERVQADPRGILSAISPTLTDADLAMVNLETAITARGEAEPGKNFHFRSPPASFDALRAAGVDVTTMANNHGLDYGRSGLQDTLAAIETSRFPVIGIGRNATDAFRPYRTTVNGQRIAVLTALDWLEPALKAKWSATDAQPGLATAFDRTRLLTAVRATRPEVDTLVVYLHWGTERDRCADAEQKSLARDLAAAGADVIVGAHAHRVQGAGRMGDAFVAYGLGNFTWWREDGENGRTGVLRVTATGRHVGSYEWVPARIRNSVPVPVTGPGAGADVADWQQRRACSGLAP